MLSLGRRSRYPERQISDRTRDNARPHYSRENRSQQFNRTIHKQTSNSSNWCGKSMKFNLACQHTHLSRSIYQILNAN